MPASDGYNICMEELNNIILAEEGGDIKGTYSDTSLA